MWYKICKTKLTSAFLPCHEAIIAQNEREKWEFYYKSGISDTKYEGRFQNVKLVYKTGTSVYIRPSIIAHRQKSTKNYI